MRWHLCDGQREHEVLLSTDFWSCDEPGQTLTLTLLKLILHNWSVVLQKNHPSKDWCCSVIFKNWHFQIHHWWFFSLLLGHTSGCYATAADGRRGWNCTAFWHSQVTFTLIHFSLHKWWLMLNININHILSFVSVIVKAPFPPVHPLLLLNAELKKQFDISEIRLFTFLLRVRWEDQDHPRVYAVCEAERLGTGRNSYSWSRCQETSWDSRNLLVPAT